MRESSRSLLHRLADRLAAHAAQALGPARESWAAAMCHELQHIANGREALGWALGCVLASYVERSGAVPLLQRWYTRALLSVFILTQASSMLLATVLTASYRSQHFGIAEFFGAFTPGEDYRRYIPLMNATPWWMHALWVAATLLFLASGWQFLRQSAAAFPLFVTACVLGLVGDLCSHVMPAYQQAFSFAEPHFLRDYFIPTATVTVPLLVAAALWVHSRFAAALHWPVEAP